MRLIFQHFLSFKTHGSPETFRKIYEQLNQLVPNVAHKKLHNKYAICPIDSTIITLTSKLLWVLGYYQVKLFSALNLATGSPDDNLINFGNEHDYKFGSKMMSKLPANAVGVIDRGFSRVKFIQELVPDKNILSSGLKTIGSENFSQRVGQQKLIHQPMLKLIEW